VSEWLIPALILPLLPVVAPLAVLYAFLRAILYWLGVMPRYAPFGPGLCQVCGYDLRASRGACPECGFRSGSDSTGTSSDMPPGRRNR
jgi:hypothetical protein